MTYFEAKGVDFQYNAINSGEAKKYFAKSCNRCTTRGMHINCDRCAIANVHGDILEFFKSKERI